MEEGKKLTRETVEKAFAFMGEYLRDRKVIGEIALFGGTAIMLQFDWRASTSDVDAVIMGSSHGAVRKAADEAAKRFGLPRSWLNEGVSVYRLTEKDGDTTSVGMYPSYERPGLRVMAANPRYLLAMKLMALERMVGDERDFRDAVMLAREIGMDDVTEMRSFLERWVGEGRIPSVVDVQLADVCERVRQHSAAPGGGL